MKIGLLNVKYSQNLGDGVIAECIEHYIEGNLSNVEVVSIDIGGRSGFGVGGSIFGGGLSLMNLLRRFPVSIFKLFVRYILPVALSYRYRSEWSDRLRDVDVLVIGGGHLFQDVDLYFPQRISLAISCAANNAPILVYAVGVSSSWSSKGLSIFQDIFKTGRVTRVSVRDQRSKNNLIGHFKISDVNIYLDPGLLAKSVYKNENPLFAGVRPVLSFGISDPGELAQHSLSAADVVAMTREFYADLIREIGHKYQINLFSNGADLDNKCLMELSSYLSECGLGSEFQTLPVPIIPAELVKIISSSSVVVSHRLHASIVAYSFRIPSIGLSWDKKLQSFFEITRREKYFVDGSCLSVKNLERLIESALYEGVDEKICAMVIDDAKSGLDDIVEYISNYKNARYD